METDIVSTSNTEISYKLEKYQQFDIAAQVSYDMFYTLMHSGV